jgi:hypothetical protein
VLILALPVHYIVLSEIEHIVKMHHHSFQDLPSIDCDIERLCRSDRHL